jgi:hypothetical protein
MKKIFSLITLMVLVFFSTAYSQGWTNLGAFPDTSFKGSTGGHGIAVDPDGKIWFGFFGTSDSVFVPDSGKYKAVRAIYVFNPDGTPASFSPIKSITVGGVTDYLYNSFRGMRADNNGNILYSSFDVIYRVNYQTGEGMAKVQPVAGMSLTAPAVSPVSGNVFVGPVVPGQPIKEYTTDFAFLGDVVTASIGFSRTLEVSDSGNTVYWAGYTNNKILVYQRPDEFTPFELKDSVLFGMACESLTWDPERKLLWASSGSDFTIPNQDPDHVTSWTYPTWYGWDPVTNTVVDSMKWAPYGPEPYTSERPRGMDFSPDGMYSYACIFGSSAYPAIQKFMKSAPATVDVEFQVDMGVQAYKGTFNPATDVVKLAGNFTEWATNALVMTDLDGDTVYTVTKAFNVGETLEFKFIKDIAGTLGWEGVPNRKITVPATNSVYSAWFDNDSTYRILTPVNVTFQCNMEFEIVAGRFNPATDTARVSGSFNGWNTKTWSMIPSISDPNVYEVTGSYNTFASEVLNSKFIYATASGTTWETGDNRQYTVTASDISNGFAFIPVRTFNDLTLDNVTNQPTTIKFTVNVANAMSAVNLQPLAPVTDVRLCGANPPLRWPGGGWPNADVNLTIQMYDDGTNGDVTAGDNIWSREVTFAKYSPLAVEYKYGANWGLPTNQGGNDNENGVGANHNITLTPTMTFGIVENVFGTMGDHEVITGVTDRLPGTPSSYELSQNFPNPFNPSTSIRFSIPEAGLVTLRVFTLLGEEVTTLVNDYMNAGSYNVEFDASRLTTGVYFYTISVNNFASTKKMILTK